MSEKVFDYGIIFLKFIYMETEKIEKLVDSLTTMEA